ncbi:MAG: GNAT family N-acetyltransferase [Deltaproteobacteria bacterium]|nr:GNAT family N-acetyltransferase [Deltaproteobacteria bacterium]
MDEIFRPFEDDDVDDAVAASVREGWAAGRDWLEALVEHDPEGCFAATSGGRTVARLTSTRYARTGWIGNLIVDPGHRRRGLGTRLFVHALHRLEALGATTVRLEADAAGVSIYRRLGFVDEFESTRFLLRGPRPVPASDATRLDASDLPDIAALDAAAFGDDRMRLLSMIHARAACAFATREGGRISGYALAVRTNLGAHVGPLVARHTEAAADLLSACMLTLPGMPLTIGVPGPNRGWCDLLRAIGFEQRVSSLRMVRGAPAAEGRISSIYAIGNGACG